MDPTTELRRSTIASFAASHFFTGMMLFSFKAVGTTIEDAYALSSTMTGIIVSFPEIGYLLSLLPVAILASRHSRPAIIAGGSILMAAGAGVFCLPYLLCDPFNVSSSTAEGEDMEQFLCQPNKTERGLSISESEVEGKNSTMACETAGLEAMFLVGGLLVGIGAGPVATLHFSYIDDRTSSTKSSMYLGIVQASSLLGIISNYFVVGAVAKFHLGFQSRLITPWWLGFAVASVGCIASTSSFWCLPDSRVVSASNEENSSESTGESGCLASRTGSAEPSSCEENEGEITYSLGSQTSFVRVLIDPRVWTALVAVACWHFPPTLNGTFVVKYMHLLFGLPLTGLNATVGILTSVPALVGIPLGGFFVSQYQLGLKEMARYLLLFATLASFTISIGCHGGETVRSSLVRQTYTSNCSNFCSCGYLRDSHLVCCHDGQQYPTPCHAGCKRYDNDTKTYHLCDCATATSIASTGSATCVEGVCKAECGTHKIVLFASLLMIKILLLSLCYIPFGIFLMRSVHPSWKAMIIALRELFGKFLGEMIGSVAVGSVFDSSCILHSGINRSECILYDLGSLQQRYFLVNFLPFVCGATMLLATTLLTERTHDHS